MWTETDTGYCIEVSDMNPSSPMPELNRHFPFSQAKENSDREGDLTHWEWTGPNGKVYVVFND